MITLLEKSVLTHLQDEGEGSFVSGVRLLWFDYGLVFREYTADRSLRKYLKTVKLNLLMLACMILLLWRHQHEPFKAIIS